MRPSMGSYTITHLLYIDFHSDGEGRFHKKTFHSADNKVYKLERIGCLSSHEDFVLHNTDCSFTIIVCVVSMDKKICSEAKRPQFPTIIDFSNIGGDSLITNDNFASITVASLAYTMSLIA